MQVAMPMLPPGAVMGQFPGQPGMVPALMAGYPGGLVWALRVTLLQSTGWLAQQN
jgi:hypothetical protein